MPGGNIRRLPESLHRRPVRSAARARRGTERASRDSAVATNVSPPRAAVNASRGAGRGRIIPVRPTSRYTRSAATPSASSAARCSSASPPNRDTRAYPITSAVTFAVCRMNPLSENLLRTLLLGHLHGETRTDLCRCPRPSARWSSGRPERALLPAVGARPGLATHGVMGNPRERTHLVLQSHSR